MKGIQFPKLPRIEPEVLDEIQRDIEDLRDNFIVVDLTDIADMEDHAQSAVNQ